MRKRSASPGSCSSYRSPPVRLRARDRALAVSAAVGILGILGILGIGSGCSDGVPSDEALPGPDPVMALCDGKVCSASNTVDHLVAPMLVASRRAPAIEADEALCRRYAIDLNGLSPPVAEVREHCLGRTPRQMVDYFMNKPSAAHVPAGQPPYLYIKRREWSEILAYRVIDSDLTTTFYADVLALDGLVGRLYLDELGYDQFAVETLASAPFLRRFGLAISTVDTAQIAAAAFRIFLGREALPSEAADLGSLWRPFTLRLVNGAEAQRRFPDCVYCTHYALMLRGGACAGNEALLCQSTALGTARLSFTLPSGQFTRVDDVTGPDAAMLRTAGRLVAARRELAEAMVDRVLGHYLGWWNAGLYRPDFNLPTVRDALVDFFIAHRYRVRELEIEVLTSLLYTQPQLLREGDIAEAPLWAQGPTKPLPAEPFLDSLAAAGGVALGGCDFRFGSASGTDPRNRIAAAYTFPVSPGFDTTYYATTARKLGGCPAGTERGETSGLVPALAKREALLRLCTHQAVQASLIPPLGPELSVETALGKLLGQQAERALGRQASADEIARFVAAAAQGGCSAPGCDYKQVGTQLCLALFSSALFSYY